MPIIVCVLDRGCDMTNPYLQPFAWTGFTTGGGGNGSPISGATHGTYCAGIVARMYLANGGAAPDLRIMPVAIKNVVGSMSAAEITEGITWATNNGAHIISMSTPFSPANFGNADAGLINTAIQNAINSNVVMCVATGNGNHSVIDYPANRPGVIAVGACDASGQRVASAPIPGGGTWGSNNGPEMSVVALGINVDTSYLGAGYLSSFYGTSAAAPQVAALAALLRSKYPTMKNVKVREIIERMADKAGTIPYNPGHPNGTWNQEMGYGRVNVSNALNEVADVYIRDAPIDMGTEPFIGVFWESSDIVVRPTDDNVFVPHDPLQSSSVERGQTNYIYVRVTNRGPGAARNVRVSTRITPYAGAKFSYPTDWTLTDSTHVSPTPILATLGTIPANNGTANAKFSIDAPQIETLFGWISGNGWHPCLLAEVKADNDYAFPPASIPTDSLSRRINNLAQRNLSVIDVQPNRIMKAIFPFVVGNLDNPERTMSIKIDRSRLPKTIPLLLALDDTGSAFPFVNFDTQISREKQDVDDSRDEGMVFLERTRVRTRLGTFTGVLTLEKGSRFDHGHRLGQLTVKGGEVVLRGDKRYVDVRESEVTVQMEKLPHRMHPLSLITTIPATAEKGEQFVIRVSQQDSKGMTVGGATVVYVVK